MCVCVVCVWVCVQQYCYRLAVEHATNRLITRSCPNVKSKEVKPERKKESKESKEKKRRKKKIHKEQRERHDQEYVVMK